MRARSVVAAVSIGVTTVLVGPMAEPASAAVNATTAGTVVTAAVTGNTTVGFGCTGGKITVGGSVAAPALDCAAVTQVTVNGDGGDQLINARQLGQTAFSALPRVVATLGGGSDFISETPRADQIDTGSGNDGVSLTHGGLANTSVDLGADTNDYLYVSGTELDDTIVAASPNATVTIGVGNTSGTSSLSANNAEYLAVEGGGGDDTINTTAVIAASTIDDASINGGPGDDTMTDGVIDSELYGQAGTNTLSGGPGQDAYWSESNTDTLNGGNDTVDEWIYDAGGPRSGGRTLNGFTAGDNYVVQAHQGDVTMRIRPAPGGATLFTTSLTRPGQALIPAPLGRLTGGQAFVGALPHRGLMDIVATTDSINTVLATTGGGLIDVTIPTGEFNAEVFGTSLAVTSSYGQITAVNVGGPANYRVHGPWTNKNQGFAHRVTRDLMFRFATNAQRDAIRDQLTNGTTTRAAVAQSLINSDEYRGLDVDRVFVKYLRRVSDPGGRTYWINSIDNGKALWRFRAQLFGSNEYFTKAGGTNASYVAKAYTDVLGRAPDPGGQAFWTNKLNTGADRGSVALQFINSPEARRRLVDDQFLRFLDRLPTATEQTTWVAALPGATGEQDLIAFLANSTAYFTRS